MQNTQNRKLKLSRRDKIRRNPVPWIVILGIAVLIGMMAVYPKYKDWNDKKTAIKKIEKEVPVVKNQLLLAKEKWNEVERQFNKEKAPVVNDESQIFPEKLDIYNIVRILETFSITMKNLEAVLLKDTHFELESVTFGKPKKEKGVSKTNLTIKFSANDENIRKFVKYVQKRKLPEEFEKIEGNSDIKFLKNNLLPMMHIQSINISELKSKKEVVSKTPHFNVQLQLIVFSR